MDEAGIEYFYYDLQTDSIQMATIDPARYYWRPAGYEQTGPQREDAPARVDPLHAAVERLAKLVDDGEVADAISALHAQRCSNGLPNRYEVDHD